MFLFSTEQTGSRSVGRETNLNRPVAVPSATVVVRLLVLVATLAMVTEPAQAARLNRRVPGPVSAEVLRVVDGDTLIVRAHIWVDQNVRTHVRLADVDAPEIRGRCRREKDLARRARAFARGLLRDRRVRLLDIRYGKYAGRVVARVITASGEELGAALVRAGHARPYRGRRRRGWCSR